MTGPSAEEIAHRAQEFKITVLAQQLSLAAILHPQLPLLQVHQALTGTKPGEDVPLVIGDGPEHDEIVFSVHDVLAKATRLRGPALAEDLMGMGMLVAGTRLGDMLLAGDHLRPDVPLLQFARHFRNACAHGDRWHFNPREPRTEATCRELTLVPDLHGQRATWKTVTPRLFFHYLDDLTVYLVPSAASDVRR